MFCDTDGNRRPSPLTELAYAADAIEALDDQGDPASMMVYHSLSTVVKKRADLSPGLSPDYRSFEVP